MQACSSDQNESLQCIICNYAGPIKGESAVQCNVCCIAVHVESCYEIKKELWTSDKCCDQCRYACEENSRKCALCEDSTGIMCYLENDNKYTKKYQNGSGMGTWCHALCFHWMKYARTIASDEEFFSSVDQECAYCSSNLGHIIKCFEKNCEQHFHPSCAQKNGALVARPWKYNSDVVLHYAGCKRHKSQRYTLESLFQLLQSSEARRCLEVESVKHLTSIEAEMNAVRDPGDLMLVLCSITNCIESDCMSSKAEDNIRYDIRRLQLLYLVLWKIEGIGKIYGIHQASAGIKNFLKSAKLADTLMSLFVPATNRPNYKGPITLIDPCKVCNKPFYNRQHVFYCLNEKEPHAQHWKCTSNNTENLTPPIRKGKSSKSSTERAMKSGRTSSVQSGMNKNLEAPGPIPCLLKQPPTCGICGSLIDVRLLLFSSGDNSFIEWYQAESSRHQSAGSNVKLLSVSSKDTRSRTEQLHKDGTDVLVASSKRNRTTESDHATSEEYRLQPPQKIERINVQRTTKWLGNVIAVIQLAVIKSEVKMSDSEHNTNSLYAIRPEALDTSIENCFQQAMEIAKSCDTYAFTQLQKAHEMLVAGKGLPFAMLNTLVKEFTCAIYAKHTKAVEKVNHEKNLKTLSDKSKKRSRK